MPKRTRSQFEQMLTPMAVALALGIVIGWLLHAWGPPRPVETVARLEAPAAREPEDTPLPLTRGANTTHETVVANETAAPVPPSTIASRPIPTIGAPGPHEELEGAIDILRRRHLRMPIDGVAFESFKDGFSERRTGSGGHVHEAVDMLAPRNTPIRAVEDGTIAKIFESKAGGHTVYQFDPGGRFTYYYAHLERYADGLREGQKIAAGDLIGYVGTSGNAPPSTPHLHFSIFEMDEQKHWWQGRPIDPYLVFRR